MVRIGKINRRFPKKVKKNIEFNKYVATFAIATLLLLVGIIIGNYLSNQKISAIKEMENNIQLDIMSLEIQSLLFEQNPCLTSLSPISDKLSETSDKISYMEDQLGKQNSQVINLKKYYSMIQIKHYLLIKERKEKCKTDDVIILFFYSNSDENIKESEKQGYVLSYFAEKYGREKIKVYSLDGDLDLEIIRDLKKIEDIFIFPTTIVNGKQYIGFHPREDFERDF